MKIEEISVETRGRDERKEEVLGIIVPKFCRYSVRV